jgi:hypothetical protein
MGVEMSPHVSARQILKWILPFYRAGTKEVAGVHLDLYPYHTPTGGFLTFMLSLEAGPHAMVVLYGECREDLSGPVQIQGYHPGLWCSDLHRAAILAYDDSEDEA